MFLTKDELELREEYRELVRREVAPFVEEIDEKDVVPRALVEKLVKPPFSLTALSIPPEFGGLGHGAVKVGLVAEELGHACPALIPFLEIAQLYGHVIVKGGSAEQKERFLTRLANGEIGCYALTDEGPGSDPASMTTVAKPASDGYELSGLKRIITFADMADLFAIFAKREDVDDPVESISAFVVEKGTPGLKLESHCRAVGLRGHRAYNVRLEGVRVPRENLIEKAGLRLALSVLNTTRVSLAFGFVGLARAAYEAAVKFAGERVVRGRPISQRQAISFPIAELATQIDAARLLALRAARMEEAGLRHRKETSMAKYYAGDVLLKAVDLAARVHGGFAGDEEYPVQRFLRDAYTWVAAQGTTEVQKLVVAREIFG